MNKKIGILSRLALLGTAIIWGTSFVVLKNTLNSMSTLWLLTIRFTVSALLLCVAANKHLAKMSQVSFRGSVMMGVCLAVAYIVQTYGLVFTTPGKNAFLTSTYCVLVPFLAWGIYKRRPGWANIAAAFLCVAGIGFVSLSSSFSDINIGDILTLICGIFYALQIIMMEQYGANCDALSLSAVQFSAAALVCLLGAVMFEPLPKNVPHTAWFSIAYLSVMCTAVCFYLQAWGMKHTPSALAAVIMTLESVFGALTSVLFYHEPLTLRLFAGFTLIFVSVLISEAFPKMKKKESNS